MVLNKCICYSNCILTTAIRNASLIPGACLRSDIKYEQDQDMRGSVLYPAPSNISLECLTGLRSNRTCNILVHHTRVGPATRVVLQAPFRYFAGFTTFHQDQV